MTQELSVIRIYEHYLNVVRKIINIKLTVLHEYTKLYFFGHGHVFLHSTWASKSLCKYDRNGANKSSPRQERAHVSKVIMVLIRLAGDIHLNPGPTLEYQVSQEEAMPDIGVSLQELSPLFTPAAHALDLEEILAHCQEMPEQRHAGKRSTSEPRVRTSDCDLSGELSRLIDPQLWTGSGATVTVGGAEGFCSRSDDYAQGLAMAEHANLCESGVTVNTLQTRTLGQSRCTETKVLSTTSNC